jgi:transposase
MYYVGCDQHKYYTQVMVKDQNGSVIDQRKLRHDNKDVIEEYFSSMPKESSVLLEATGFELGLNVKLAHPSRTRAIAEERIMTDKISANVLADLLRANLVSEAYIASPEIRAKRFRMRYRQSLIHMRTMAKNRIHAMLARLGISVPPLTDIFGKKGRAYLQHLDLAPIYRRALDGYLDLIDTTTSLSHLVDLELYKELKENEQLRLITTIPGIGKVVGHIILAEIGDIKRFLSSAKLASYAGIVPSLHQSGKVAYSGSITKTGNRYLRWALVEAAHMALRTDPYLRMYYDKIRAKKGTSVAVVAIAHKLLCYAYQVLTKNQEYKPKAIPERARLKAGPLA